MLKKTMLVVLLFAVTTAAQVAGTIGSHPIDNAHSTVGFSVPILGGLSQVKGKFTDFSITLNHD